VSDDVDGLLDDIDRDALLRSMSMAMRDPQTARELNDKLAGSGEFLPPQPWIDVATTAAYRCQSRALHLKPWQIPPLYCYEGDKDGEALLRRMLDAGLSRYEPDPLRALDKNAKRFARLKKNKKQNEKA
jgi:hypothetical protein